MKTRTQKTLSLTAAGPALACGLAFSLSALAQDAAPAKSPFDKTVRVAAHLEPAMKVTGIPYVMRAYRKEAETILAQ